MGGVFYSSSSLFTGNQHWLHLVDTPLTSDARQTISTALGALCVIVWFFAEIPQLITNYREKSIDGLSVTFLITWIIGDLFNVFGCLLEPSTLPTQLYTALLYTFITLILCSQAIYYGHIYPRLKHKKLLKVEAPTDVEQNNCGNENANDADQGLDDLNACTGLSFPVPVPVPALTQRSTRRESHYMSPRYLSKSHTAIAESIFARGRTSATRICDTIEEPLLGSTVSTQSEPILKIKTTLCLVSSLTLFGAFNLLNSQDKRIHSMDSTPRQELVFYVGRKLVQVSGDHQPEHAVKGPSGFGSLLGWAMAFIYMGGRLPQICLNIKRGHTEGVNPLMFLLAIIGNGSYVASILVRSLDWSIIRPNLPWLVESGGCVLLDCFIVIQFIYFRYWTTKHHESKHQHQIVA